MSGENAAIDIDYEPIPATPAGSASSCSETSGQLLEFPKASATVSDKFPESFPVTTAKLSETFEVSEVTIRKWIKRFSETIPLNILSPSRGRYSETAWEMIERYAAARSMGLTLDSWLSMTDLSQWQPTQQQRIQSTVSAAEAAGAIVPAAVVQGQASQQDLLTRAQQFGAIVRAVAEETELQLQSAQLATSANRQLTDRELKKAEILLQIQQEKRLEAEIRAEIEEEERQRKIAELQQQMNELQGGAQ